MSEEDQVSVSTKLLSDLSMVAALIWTTEIMLNELPDTIIGVDLGEFRAAQQKLSDQVGVATRKTLGIKD